MGKERADLGFADPLDDFNPAEWEPKAPKPDTRKPKPETAAKIAEASGFKSREPRPAPAEPAQAAQSGAGEGAPVRRRRTGRNAQFNLKARPETIEAYCAIADRMGWGLGETLERAVELLAREYSSS